MQNRSSVLIRYPHADPNERQQVMDRNRQTGLETAAEHARNTAEAVYRSDSRHVLATLIRLLGDFDIAEEALHESEKRFRCLVQNSSDIVSLFDAARRDEGDDNDFDE